MLIVSLTTTRSRLFLCRYTLLSLCNQTALPDKIILWISREPYLKDEGVNQLPAWLEEYCARFGIVDVRLTPNTGPYRKLLPVLSVCGDDDEIVTADDDIIYGERWLEILIAAFRSAPDHVQAGRVRKIRRNILGTETTYMKWPVIIEPGIIPDDFVVTFGGGAVLKKSFFPRQYLSSTAYLTVAPKHDDLWYSMLLRLGGTEVCVEPRVLQELYFINHEQGLAYDNMLIPRTWWQRVRDKQKERFLGEFGYPICGNDVAFKNIKKHFADFERKNR